MKRNSQGSMEKSLKTVNGSCNWSATRCFDFQMNYLSNYICLPRAQPSVGFLAFSVSSITFGLNDSPMARVPRLRFVYIYTYTYTRFITNCKVLKLFFFYIII